MELSIEQFMELKKIEKHLNTAYYHHFITHINTDELDTAGRIWNELFGKYERLNFACQSCVISTFNKLGRLYYENIDKIIEKINIEENGKEIVEQITNEEPTGETIKGRRGRPKRN